MSDQDLMDLITASPPSLRLSSHDLGSLRLLGAHLFSYGNAMQVSHLESVLRLGYQIPPRLTGDNQRSTTISRNNRPIRRDFVLPTKDVVSETTSLTFLGPIKASKYNCLHASYVMELGTMRTEAGRRMRGTAVQEGSSASSKA